MLELTDQGFLLSEEEMDTDDAENKMPAVPTLCISCQSVQILEICMLERNQSTTTQPFSL